MSGDDQGAGLDLDAIEARSHDALMSVSHIPIGMVSRVVTDSVEDVPALVAEVRRLRRWKEEALPVIRGLQDLGRALDLPIGVSITGKTALDAALDLRNRAEAAERGEAERA